MDETSIISPVEHFASLRNPGFLPKTGHKLIDIVVITICAVIAGADEWMEIPDYARAREDWFRTFLELPEGIPSHDTFGRVMSRIVPEEFGKCLNCWVREVFPANGDGIITIDGKTARRPHDRANGKSAIHMVSTWAFQDHLILGQEKAEEESNEIKAIPELLKVIDVEGCVVTVDAMECREEIAGQIVTQGGDFVFVLKGNQGNPHKDVELLFEKAKEYNYKDLSFDTYTTVNAGHGRLDFHRYTTINDVTWFDEQSQWPKPTTFGMIESEHDMGDHAGQETRYFISSLPNNARCFAEVDRGHWEFKDTFHWCLDVAFCGDDSRARKGYGAMNLAIINRFALSLIKLDPFRKVGVKASLKRAGWDPNYLLHLLRI